MLAYCWASVADIRSMFSVCWVPIYVCRGDKLYAYFVSYKEKKSYMTMLQFDCKGRFSENAGLEYPCSNMRHSANADSMLASSTLGQHWNSIGWMPHIGLLWEFIQCIFTVFDAGPTLKQHCVNAPCRPTVRLSKNDVWLLVVFFLSICQRLGIFSYSQAVTAAAVLNFWLFFFRRTNMHHMHRLSLTSDHMYKLI